MFSAYKIYFIIGGVIALLAGLAYYRHTIIINERERVTAIWQKKELEWQVLQYEVLARKNRVISDKQAELDRKTKEIVIKDRELENAKKSYSDLRAKYTSGALRLSVYTTKPKGVGAKYFEDAAAPSGVLPERRELVPEVSANILDFARHYSHNLRLKNRCIQLYETTRDAINN